MIEKTMNKRLFPVFQAANATITRMTTKTTPPVVTSIGKPLAATSAKADRVSGGTTRIIINKTKSSEAIAPTLLNSGTPSRRAIKVSIAVARPASTSSVPRIARHHEDKDDRINDEVSSDLLAGGVGFNNPVVLPLF